MMKYCSRIILKRLKTKRFKKKIIFNKSYIALFFPEKKKIFKSMNLITKKYIRHNWILSLFKNNSTYNLMSLKHKYR